MALVVEGRRLAQAQVLGAAEQNVTQFSLWPIKSCVTANKVQGMKVEDYIAWPKVCVLWGFPVRQSGSVYRQQNWRFASYGAEGCKPKGWEMSYIIFS